MASIRCACSWRATRGRPGEDLHVRVEGDSITHGFNGDYTWRYRLAREVERQGATIDFVGSKHTPYVAPGYRTSVYLGGSFDSDHFATGGSRLYQHADWIPEEAAQQRPDVVVLAAGLNDLRAGISPERVNDSLRTWIANLRSVVPHVRILLSPILASIDATKPWLTDRTTTYNALLRQTASAETTATSPITVAGTTNGWSATKYTSDGTHPNPTGETVIAQRIAEGLNAMGVLGPVNRIAAYTRWDQGLTASVSVARGRAGVRWDREALSSARLLVRAPGGPERMLPHHYYAGTATVPILDGGRYTFRLVAERRMMTSTPGPLKTVQVSWSLGVPPAAVRRVKVSSARVTWTASARASAYLVSTRRAGTSTWRTVRTGALSVKARRVVEAKVWALNPAGHLAPRRVHR